MKARALLILLLIPFTLLAQWTKTAGPVETSAATLEIVGTKLFVGTVGNGLFSSADSGGHWSKVSNYPDSSVERSISRIVYHYNPFMFTHYLYVATTDHIYRSMNNGISFQYADSTLPDTLRNYNLYQVNNAVYATAQTVDPLTFNTTSELFYFNDFTNVWQQVNNIPPGYEVTGMAALHDTIYCAMFGHGIYRTRNNGVNWDSLNLINGRLLTNNIRLLATDGQKLYGISYENGPSVYGPYIYSTTNTINWTSAPLSFTGGNTISNIVAQNSVVCLGSPGAIYISKDAGANWNATTTPYSTLTDAKFLGTSIIAADPGNGFLRTLDDSNWYVSNTGLNYSSTYHLANQYGSIYAMDAYNTFHTNNHGSSWVGDTSLLFNMNRIARMGDKLIGFSKHGQNDLFSMNNGNTWSLENIGGVGILVNNYIVDNANRQIYGWGQADIRRSNDYGTTWKPLFYPNANNTHDTLFTSFTKVGTRLIATITDPVAKMLYSDDSGNTWAELTSSGLVYHAESIGNTLLLGTDGGVKKSTDFGVSSAVVYGGKLFQTYVNGTTIFNFQGPYPQSIAYSTDYGSNWTDISLPDSLGTVNDIVMDDSCLYAATNGHSVWKRKLSEIGIVYTPDTSNNYSINVGVNLLANNEKPVVSIYPNPFTNQFSIAVTTTATHYIDVKMYDAAGRCVQVLAQGSYPQGTNKFSANITLPAGIYYVTAIVDGSIITKKVIRY